MRPRQVRNSKIILLVSSLVFLAFLLLAAFEENFTAPWRLYQKQYARALADAARAAGQSPAPFPLEIRQVYLEELKRVDRCVTCHVAIDNPAFKNQPIPLAAHPGDLLEHHPSEKFGCTICHQGQGRATIEQDAHGRIPHWPEPMLKGDLVYTSCGRCHYENDLYGGQSDLYGQVRAIERISVGELAARLPGADRIARGKQLVIAKGCLGCHKYRGRGGSLGPDITYVGEKTVHDFDFQHVSGERTVENWMFTHFQSPSAVVPGTLMPELDLTDEEARDLTAYVLSLKRKSAPAAYTPLPHPIDPTPVEGETLYLSYCSACHGPDGVGATVRDPLAAERVDRPRELITPSLRNIDTLATCSDAFLRQIMANGRPGTSMPGWKVQGLSDGELDQLVQLLRGWQPRAADVSSVSSSRGDPSLGRVLYRANCAGCHGRDGEGGDIGVSLRSPTFLAIASDEFLAESIIRGRANTAMPAWSHLDNGSVSDLLAYLRSWQPLRSQLDEVLAVTARRDASGVPHPLPTDSRHVVAETAATSQTRPDATRPATHLLAQARALGAGLPTSPVAQSGPDAEPSVADQPSVEVGRKLFRSRCTVCHGESGQGGIGPSLNNSSVLTVVSDTFLAETVIRGRPGTSMPAWRQLNSRDVADLIALVRSWQTDPARELPPVVATGDWQNGELLYRGMCASCHGPQAEGAIGPQLSNPVFLETVPDAVLVHWISYGRMGTAMRPFLRGQQGAASLSPAQIEDIVTYLRSLRGQRPEHGERIGIGYAPRGQLLFQQMCSSCHGENGQGASGPGIRNPDFLAAASDGFLRATIVLGREGTEMRSLAHRGSGIAELAADEIDDLIAFLRTAQDSTPIPHRFVIGAHLDRGRQLYQSFCAGCHGADGRGGFAPELNNPEFLRAATDGYLAATIIRGRRGTAMRPFAPGSHGIANLTQNEINDIVAFIRQWSPDTRLLRRTETFPVPAGSNSQITAEQPNL